MSDEFFFSFPESSKTIEDLRSLDKINSLYKTSSKAGKYVVGTSGNDYGSIPSHDGLENLKFRLDYDIENFKKTPTLVSVLSFRSYSEKKEFNYFTRNLKKSDGGLLYEKTRIYHKIGKNADVGMELKFNGHSEVKNSLSSKVSKISLSENVRRTDDSKGSLRQQFMVLEFTGAPNSSSKITDYLADNVKDRLGVLDVRKFSVLDKLI